MRLVVRVDFAGLTLFVLALDCGHEVRVVANKPPKRTHCAWCAPGGQP